ncbi:uncharacterized protein LOC114285297 [Camellia sinensis]|uniref:uncharacterized protein LOC114285297 n=1 Tax=Camellia sinensis TaxID=4442 RepID=UPI001036D244|nr:uncharacterized protein LOC114285297 [Camellia sinensis]
MSNRSVGRGIAVPLAPVVTVSAIGEEVACEVVRAVQDALARNEGDNRRTLKLTKEFLRSNPPEFLGEARSLEAESWLEQITKTLDMLRVEDEGLRVSLATFLLKGDANYWWKYVKGIVGATWVAFTDAFLAKYFPHSAREEERRCYEFERRLRDDIREKVVRSKWKNYYDLVEVVVHAEVMVSSVGQARRKATSVTPTVHKHPRLSKRWRRAHAHSQTRSLFSSGVSSSSVGGSSEVQAPNWIQSWEAIVCFDCGQRGHARRFFPLDLFGVSKSSRSLSHQSSRGCYRYQTRRGQASEASRESTFKPAQYYHP